MIEEIDLHLFLQIIENEGCFCRWQEVIDDTTVYHYLSKSSTTKEVIYGGDESLCRTIAEKHLDKLELSNLKPVMCYTKIDFGDHNQEAAE